jgi:hypothetical protein
MMINTMRLATLLLLALLHELPSAAGFSTPPSASSLSSRAIIASNGVINSNCAATSSLSARQMSLHRRGYRQRSGGLLRMADGGEAAAAAVPPAKSGFFEKVNHFELNHNLYQFIVHVY